MRPHVLRAGVLLLVAASFGVACGDDSSLSPGPGVQGSDAAVPTSVTPVPDASQPDAGQDSGKPEVSLAASILGADLVPSDSDLDPDLAYPEDAVFPADLLPPF